MQFKQRAYRQTRNKKKLKSHRRPGEYSEFHKIQVHFVMLKTALGQTEEKMSVKFVSSS